MSEVFTDTPIKTKIEQEATQRIKDKRKNLLINKRSSKNAKLKIRRKRPLDGYWEKVH